MITQGQVKYTPQEILKEINELPPDKRKSIEERIIIAAIQKLISAGKYREAIELAREAMDKGFLPPSFEKVLAPYEKLLELKNWIADAYTYLSEVSGKKIDLNTIASLASDAQHLKNVAYMIEYLASEIPWGKNRERVLSNLEKLANTLRDLATWSVTTKEVLEATKKWLSKISHDVNSLLSSLNVQLSSTEDLDRLTSIALWIASRLNKIAQEDLARLKNELYTIIEVPLWRTSLGKAIHDALKQYIDKFVESVSSKLTKLADIVSTYANALLAVDNAYTYLQTFIHHLALYGKNGYVLGNSNYVDMLRDDLVKLAIALKQATDYASRLSALGASKLAEGISKLIGAIRKSLLDAATNAINVDPRFYDYLSSYLKKCGVNVASPYRTTPLKKWYEIIEKIMKNIADQAKLAFLAGVNNLNKVWGAPLAVLGAIAELGTGMINTLLSMISPLHIYEMFKSMIDLGKRTAVAAMESGITGIGQQLKQVAEAMFGTPERALQTAGMFLLFAALPEALERIGLSPRLSQAIASALSGDPFTPIATMLMDSVDSITRLFRAIIRAEPQLVDKAISIAFKEGEPIEVTERAIREALLKQGIKLSENLTKKLARDFFYLAKRAKTIAELEKELKNEVVKGVLKDLALKLRSIEERASTITSDISRIEKEISELAARINKLKEELAKPTISMRRIRSEYQAIKREIESIKGELAAITEAEKELLSTINEIAAHLPKEKVEYIRNLIESSIEKLSRSGIRLSRLEKLLSTLRKDIPRLVRERNAIESKLLTDITRLVSELEKNGVNVPDISSLLSEGRYGEAIDRLAQLIIENAEKLKPTTVEELLNTVRKLYSDLMNAEKELSEYLRSVEEKISSIVKSAGTKAASAIADIEKALDALFSPAKLHELMSRLAFTEKVLVKGEEALKLLGSTIGRDLEEFLARYGSKLRKAGVNVKMLRRLANDLIEGRVLISEKVLDEIVKELSKASKELATVYGSKLLAELAGVAKRVFGEGNPITEEIERLLKKVKIYRRVKVELSAPASEVEAAVTRFLEVLSHFEPEIAREIAPALRDVVELIRKIESGEEVTKREVVNAIKELDSIRNKLYAALIPSKLKRGLVSMLSKVIEKIDSLLGKVPKETILYSFAEDLADIAKKLREAIEETTSLPENYVIVAKAGSIERGTLIAAPSHLSSLIARLTRGWDRYTVRVGKFELRVARRIVLKPGGEADMYWIVELPNGMYFGIKITSKLLKRGRKAVVYREVSVFYDPRLPRYARTHPEFAALLRDLSKDSIYRFIRDIDPTIEYLSRAVLIYRGVEIPFSKILGPLSSIPLSIALAGVLRGISAPSIPSEIPSLSPSLLEQLAKIAQAITLPKPVMEQLKNLGIQVFQVFKVPNLSIPIALIIAAPSSIASDIVGYTTIQIGSITIKIPVINVNGVKIGLIAPTISLSQLTQLETELNNVVREAITTSTTSVTARTPEVTARPVQISPVSVSGIGTAGIGTVPSGITLTLPGGGFGAYGGFGVAGAGVQKELLELV